MRCWIPAATACSLTLVLCLSAVSAGPGRAESPEPSTMTVLSPVFEIDQRYRSMMGPLAQQPLLLGAADSTELVWITGFRAEMVGPDGESAMPAELMCHSNLDLDVAQHRQLVRASPGFSPRLFTLSQGQLEVRFPEGFGIPVRSDEALSLTTQVLNLNFDGVELKARHRTAIDYVADRDAEGMTPLFPVSAYGLVLLEGEAGYYGVEHPESAQHGESCLPGQGASSHRYPDGMGRSFSGHWVVEPGRQVNHTLVTELMQVPYDTTVHYVAVHLHPFAESLTLRDLTTGETLFTSRARNFEDRIGLASVQHYSDAEGFPLFADHEYQLVSVYDNTTDEPQDSMAVMYLYLADKVFEAEASRVPAAR